MTALVHLERILCGWQGVKPSDPSSLNPPTPTPIKPPHPFVLIWTRRATGVHMSTTPGRRAEKERIDVYISTNFTGAACYCVFVPRSGVLRTQKLKTRLLRTQSSKLLPFKPGTGPYITMHARPTARDFFRAYFYPSGPFACIFPKPLPGSSCLG